MNGIFTYSILQYKPSLLSGEVLNVGILFFFYEEKKIEFVYDDTNRLKLIFTDFDSTLYTSIVTAIGQKIRSSQNSLFNVVPSISEIKEFIDGELITEDSASLQFTETINSVQITKDTSKIIKDFTQLFLPYFFNSAEIVSSKKDDEYLVKKFNAILRQKDDRIDQKIARNKLVIANKVEVKFEYEWNNDVGHLVKALSFDLKKKHFIQEKIVLYEGYFRLLSGYADLNKKRFDILAIAPQDESLLNYYHDTIDILRTVPSPVSIYQEDQLEEYAAKAVNDINDHFGVEH